jgi:hypothetical protein
MEMLKSIAMIALMLITVAATAGTVVLKEPPSPQQGLFPADSPPYSFVTGFSPDGKTIEGVCGYYGVNNVHAWYACSWPLTIVQQVPGGYQTSIGAPVLGVQICCSVYGERAPKVVYGPFSNYAGDIAGARNQYGPYLTTP